MVWGGGILQRWGVLDFAGGIVVHNIAGLAALASVLYVGKRHVLDRGPHSIPLVALGTGLLWFGWYGFNAGSEMRVDSVTGNRIPEYRYRRFVRRRDLAGRGLVPREESPSSSDCSPAQSPDSRPSLRPRAMFRPHGRHHRRRRPAWFATSRSR